MKIAEGNDSASMFTDEEPPGCGSTSDTPCPTMAVAASMSDAARSATSSLLPILGLRGSELTHPAAGSDSRIVISQEPMAHGLSDAATDGSSETAPVNRCGLLTVTRAPRCVGSNPQTRAFRRKFYPEVADRDWNDWRWQSRHRIRRLDQFEQFLSLSPDERSALISGGTMLPVGVTPYYLSLSKVIWISLGVARRRFLTRP